MAFATIADVTTGTHSGTSYSVAMPSTVNANDLLIMIVAADSAPTFSTAASGWTEKFDTTSSSNHGSAIFQKKADGTEGGTTVTVSLSENQGGCALVIRVNQGTWTHDENDVEYGTQAKDETQTDDNPDAPSLTASWGSDDNLWITYATAGDDDATVSSYPTNYSDNQTELTGGHGTNESAQIYIASRNNATATEDVAQWTLSATEAWIAGTIVIRPAASGTVTVVKRNISVVTKAPTVIASLGLVEVSKRNLSIVTKAPTISATASDFPTVADITTGTHTGTSYSVAMPSTVNENDLLIMFVAADSSPTFSVSASGWTEKFDSSSGSNHGSAIYQKKADGTEGGTTVTVSLSENQGGCALVIRVNAGTWTHDENDVEYGTQDTTGGNDNPNAPSLTASWGSDSNLWITYATAGDDDATVSLYPTDYDDNQTELLGGHGTDESAQIYIATRDNVTATEDAGQWDLSQTEAWIAGTIVVRPASTASDTTVEVVKDNLSIVTKTVDVVTGYSTVVPKDILSLVTKTPVVSGGEVVAVQKSDLGIVTKTPTVSAELGAVTIEVGKVNISLVTEGPSVVGGASITVGNRELSIVTKAPIIVAFTPIVPEKRNVSLVTKAPSILVSSANLIVGKSSIAIVTKTPTAGGGVVLDVDGRKIGLATGDVVVAGGDSVQVQRRNLSLVTKAPKLPFEQWTEIVKETNETWSAIGKATNETWSELSKATDETWDEVSKGTDQTWSEVTKGSNENWK